MGADNQAAKVVDAIEMRELLAATLENTAPPRDWGITERSRIAAALVKALKFSGRRWNL